MEDSTLICKECQSPFVATGKWRSYAGHWCPDCRRTYMRAVARKHRTRAPEAYRAKQRRYAKNNPAKARAWSATSRDKKRSRYAALKSGPCTDCKVAYPPYVMHFDHLDAANKLTCVGHIKACGIERILKETAKCELVCANCHAERTYKRAQEKNALTRVQSASRADGDLRPPS